LPNQSRQDNARIHQRLFDESRSAVAGEYGKVEVRLKVARVRRLTPRIAVVHARSEFRGKDQPEKRTKNIVTAVIHLEDLDTEQGGKEMIKDVPLTGVFVNDQDAALDFYTNKLGLEKVQDEPYGEGGARWITVSPVGYRTRIVLKKAEHDYEKALVGRSDGAPILTLGTNDVRAVYERLRERGVRFLGEPYRYPWGIGALLLDQDGSPILLQQEDSGGR
jgi:catechol 2,3-dioxygenase-like lactoylglutathione lyase family enzyme